MLLALIGAALLASPLVGASATAVPILTLDEHDYVYPRLSPDGRRLVVARAVERPDGTETTDIILVDVASGAARELIGRREAEANEVYETFVIGLRWLDNRRVEVNLSDGDVGGTDLVVDASTGEILRTDSLDDGDLLVPSEFAGVVADARFYRRHFNREELERSLGSSAIRLSETAILVQRTPRQAASRPIFYIEPATRRIRRIAALPQAAQLRDAALVGSSIAFLAVDDGSVSVHSYDGVSAKALATWSVPTRNQCPRMETVAARMFVFVRPCTRSKPAQAKLWEVTAGAVIHRALDDNLDEFSASADASRIAVGVWRNGKRIVRVFDGSVLRPAG